MAISKKLGKLNVEIERIERANENLRDGLSNLLRGHIEEMLDIKTRNHGRPIVSFNSRKNIPFCVDNANEQTFYLSYKQSEKEAGQAQRQCGGGRGEVPVGYGNLATKRFLIYVPNDISKQVKEKYTDIIFPALRFVLKNFNFKITRNDNRGYVQGFDI